MLVSVVIPVFNRYDTIARAIDSVLEQTHPDIEIIIVDDCSTDNTISVIRERYANNERVLLLQNKRQLGACATRNVGISHCSGDYIAFNDSDDKWFPNKLTEQIQILNDKDADIVGSSYHLQEPHSVIIPSMDSTYITYREALKHSYMSTQTIIAKKEVFQKVTFDEKLKRFQDWDFLICSSKHFRVFFDARPQVDVYLQKNSITLNNKAFLSLYDIFVKNIIGVVSHPSTIPFFVWKAIRSIL
ncbi:glycosyltransferase family 2 protein [Vibrio cyclitrophicus]